MDITKENRVWVLDGGFSSQLSKYDESFEGHPLWTAVILQRNPEAIYKTHMDYLIAGADYISTNTYQASIGSFRKHLNIDSDDQCIKLISSAVDAAKRARSDYLSTHLKRKILIAGSVGPYGACLHDGSEYTGSYIDSVSKETMKNWHRPRISTLLRSGVDLLAFETLPSFVEAECLIEMLHDYPDTRAWLSFGCRDGEHTNYGEVFRDVARKCYEMNPNQLIGVGVNCTKPEHVESLLSGINENVGRVCKKIPFIVYSNSGEDYDQSEGWINKDKCKPLDTYVEKWIELGVKYIGGCCRTYAEDIKRIRNRVDYFNNK